MGRHPYPPTSDGSYDTNPYNQGIAPRLKEQIIHDNIPINQNNSISSGNIAMTYDQEELC